MAGLLPGKSKLRRAEVLFGKSSMIRDANGHTATWAGCDGYQLVVESDTEGTVTSVKAERLLGFKPPAGCGYPMPDVGAWKTSRGLRLWSSHEDVLKMYGKPDSVSPSTKGGQRLELLYYAFDWAGPDVPQVMEVVCTVEKDGEPSRVVEITLAASSL